MSRMDVKKFTKLDRAEKVKWLRAWLFELSGEMTEVANTLDKTECKLYKRLYESTASVIFTYFASRFTADGEKFESRAQDLDYPGDEDGKPEPLN